MILPGSYITSLILLIFGMLCYGSWAATYKAAGHKWRFELYYFDFAIGMILAATVIGLTIGSFGFDGFSFTDDLRLAGKRQEVTAFAAGAIFNLGNMFLVSALSLADMSVVFPVGMGLALVIGAFVNLLVTPAGNQFLLFGGVAVVVVAIVLALMVYNEHTTTRLMENMRAGKTKSTKKEISWKAVILAIIGGLFLGSFFPLIVRAREGENGLGPYSMAWMFAVGVLLSTLVLNLFFMNLPVQGKPIGMEEFFQARGAQHVKGLIGGSLMYVAVLAGFIAVRAEGRAHVQPFVVWGLSQLGIVIAVLWGILRWKEFADASPRIKGELAVMLVLLIVGIGMASSGLATVQ